MDVKDVFKKSLETAKSVDMNVSQNIIVTTEDKLKLAIQSHSRGIGKKKDWIAPLSICFSIMISMSSSNFKDFIFSSDEW